MTPSLREEKVKEFGLVDQPEESPALSRAEIAFQTSNQSRTRSGRLSRPPHRIRKDPNENKVDGTSPEPEPIENIGVTSGGLSNMNYDLPKVNDQMQLPNPNKRNFIPPAKYICKVCGKLYLGDKKIAKHLKHFPSHEFATPEPPVIQVTKDARKGQTFESYIAECDSNSFIDQIGPKLFKSFSLWDLLVNKTTSKRLGTVESLMSLFADMQAVVMELKNLVEQCLSCDSFNEDSFSVTLTPIMSSVLGMSQTGGVTRFVLPYTQIPEHYHKLLCFPTGLRGANIVSSSTHPNLMSPESTNSIIHPEEENSQMSLSSDTLDQPLADKVVLEDNLGTRQIQDLDEETQDSSIIAPSPVNPHKRQRLDSECHSVSSPPPRTPDFLSQGDDSNLSSISTAVTEASQGGDLQKKDVETETIISSGCSSVISLHTKLPSFSSIINGSPKPTVAEPGVAGGGEVEDVVGSRVGVATTSLYNQVVGCSSFEATAPTTSSSRASLLPLQQSYSVPSASTESLGGSAPVSPRVSYGGSHLVTYNRRCSLDTTRTSAPPQDLLLGLTSKLEHTNPSHPLLDITEEDSTLFTDKQPAAHSQTVAVGSEFVLSSGSSAGGGGGGGGRGVSVVVTSQYQSDPASQPVWASPARQTAGGAVSSQQFGVIQVSQSPGQSPEQLQIHQNISGFIKLSTTPDSFQQSRQQLTLPVCSIAPSVPEFESHQPKSSILKGVPKQPAFPQGTSTHVTFSDELTHPIPSVSPAKDFRDIDLKRQNPTPPSESQSSSIFSDLESVLNEATDFTFHSELPGSERLQVKTPDKLMASVPPAVIMDNKSALSFDNILDFDKNEENKSLCNQPSSTNESSGSLTMLTQNILQNQPDFSFNDSSANGS